MRAILIVILVLSFARAEAALRTFSLKGEVLNPDENRVLVSVYRNWVEDPEEYYLYLDGNNRFFFEIALEQLAYLDLHYGLNGLLFQVIEPGDEIFLRFDTNDFYKSLQPAGKGSGKWVYEQNRRERFEVKRDVEQEIASLFTLAKQPFMQAVKSYENEQLNDLGQHRDQFSEEYFILKRADILGKMNQLRLDYLSPGDKLTILFDEFDLSEIHPTLQQKSFEYGNFVESLCDVQMLRSGIFEEGYNLTRGYLQLKYFFDNDWISKEMADRLLAAKLNAGFLVDGFSGEAETLVRDFEKFVSNQAYGRAIAEKLVIAKNKRKGEPVPDFTLEDLEGRVISLKDFRGSNVLILFWSGWCESCKEDLAAIPAITSYFRNRKDFQVLQVAVDEARFFDNSMLQAPQAGIRNIRIDPQSKLLVSMDIKTIPDFVLIDKSGNWLETKLIEPGLDEGRGLIRQLEAIFANQ